MLDKLNSQPVTRAWESRLTRIEERIAKSEQSHEQRILILRDAMSDFVSDFIANKIAPLHDEITALKKSDTELKKQLQAESDVDQRVDEVMKRLDARQIARDEAKRGKMGPQGQRGARGERGERGARGPAVAGSIEARKGRETHHYVINLLISHVARSCNLSRVAGWGTL